MWREWEIKTENFEKHRGLGGVVLIETWIEKKN